MKELKLWQKIGVVALFVLVTFSASFSTYELLFDKADAGILFNCEKKNECNVPNEPCGTYGTCTCNQGFRNFCYPISIVPEQ